MFWIEWIERYREFRKSRAIYLDLKKEYEEGMKKENKKIKRHPLEKPFFYVIKVVGLTGIALYIIGYLMRNLVLVAIGVLMLIICTVLLQIDVSVFTHGILKGVWIGDGDKNGNNESLLNGQYVNVNDYMDVMRPEIRRNSLRRVAQKHGLEDEYEVLFVISQIPPIHPVLKFVSFSVVIFGTIAMVISIPGYEAEYGTTVLIAMVVANLVFSKFTGDMAKILENGFFYRDFLEYGLKKAKMKWRA